MKRPSPDCSSCDQSAPTAAAASPAQAWRARLWRGLLLMWLAALLAPHARSNEALTLAVVPQNTPLKLYRAWSPLLRRLEMETGQRIDLKLYEKISEFEVDLLRGKTDLVYLNPYHLIMAHQAHSYRPLVRDNSTPLAGILVVPSSSQIHKVADLDGKRLAFPSPNAFGASLYLRALLVEQERTGVMPVYVGNHENVYLQVAAGQIAGGGGVRRTLDQQPESVRRHLRVIYTTPGVAPHPLAAHPRVPSSLSDRFTEGLLALARDEEGRKLLKAIQMPEPVRADFERDYGPLLKLKLEKYVHRPK